MSIRRKYWEITPADPNDPSKGVEPPKLLEPPTIEGYIVWFTIEKRNGWRVQYNEDTLYCRLISPDGVILARGAYDAIMTCFEKYAY